jgi:hypothetical protein
VRSLDPRPEYVPVINATTIAAVVA